jgi:hypothetical protein
LLSAQLCSSAGHSCPLHCPEVKQRAALLMSALAQRGMLQGNRAC